MNNDNKYFLTMREHRVSVQDVKSIMDQVGVKIPTRTIHWRIQNNFELDLKYNDLIKQTIDEIVNSKKEVVKKLKLCKMV
jgi:hypothetical protein